MTPWGLGAALFWPYLVDSKGSCRAQESDTWHEKIKMASRWILLTVPVQCSETKYIPIEAPIRDQYNVQSDCYSVPLIQLCVAGWGVRMYFLTEPRLSGCSGQEPMPKCPLWWVSCYSNRDGFLWLYSRRKQHNARKRCQPLLYWTDFRSRSILWIKKAMVNCKYPDWNGRTVR